uniref:Uncharacterized protein n=1 Tax=Oryza rufipogon TaxID=4529 RepID=A0A0E0RJP3_ORYRU
MSSDMGRGRRRSRPPATTSDVLATNNIVTYVVVGQNPIIRFTTVLAIGPCGCGGRGLTRRGRVASGQNRLVASWAWAMDACSSAQWRHQPG